MTSHQDITQLLTDLAAGDRLAFDALVPMVYDQLRGVAHRMMLQESGPRTLSATGLVHEAYTQLAQPGATDWQNRQHFFAVASRVMRRILVDQARKRNSQKRGGDNDIISLELTEETGEAIDHVKILDIDSALTALQAVNPRAVNVVECRYFAGLTVEETAESLGLSPMTVKRDWTLAKAWLARQLAGHNSRG